MLPLSRVRERVGAHRPALHSVRHAHTLEASVALVLHEATGSGRPELLFIQRAEREGDPWSGHMAFPGGRRQTEDPDLESTTLRETHEEVGFTPDRVLGRLDDFAGSRGPAIPHLVVAALVCESDLRPEIRPNHEVRSSIWVPLDWIRSRESRLWHRVGPDGEPRPAFRYEGYVVWGLTYRILRGFFQVLGEPLALDSDERG